MRLNVGIKDLKRGSNILDINVPAPLKRKVATRVDWFDDAVGGKGLTPSTVAMLTGTPGGGKTTMMLQLADSITGQGHMCIFNTGEESLYQVRNVCERLRLKHGFIPGQDIMAPDFLAHAKEIMENIKGQKANDGSPKQLFIMQDSLQCMNDGYYKDGGTTGNTPVRVTEMLANFAKETYAIVMFVGHVTKNGVFAGKNTIKHMVDVHGHIYIDDDKRSETFGERLFTVSKNRFGCNNRTYVLGLDARGLWKKGQFHMVSE
jgi:DNA repair protein RadA/Sms